MPATEGYAVSKLVCRAFGVRNGFAQRETEWPLGQQPIWRVQGFLGPETVSAQLLDLLDVAGALYRAESQIRRRATDPVVEYIVTAPVRDREFWEEDGGRLAASPLSFLSRARWTFQFTSRKGAPKSLEAAAGSGAAQSIILFSGGMDSLCGAGIHDGDRSKVRLASFYSHQLAVQRELATDIGYAEPTGFRLIGRRGKEGMNQIRAFMFLSIGAVVAHSWAAETLFQYENGVLAAAVPPSGLFVPTRHAHPEFHSRMGRLLEAVLGRRLRIENPFLNLTKREAVAKLRTRIGSQNADVLLSKTETCWYHRQAKVQSERKENGQPCGVCTPCIVRRTARPEEDRGEGVARLARLRAGPPKASLAQPSQAWAYIPSVSRAT